MKKEIVNYFHMVRGCFEREGQYNGKSYKSESMLAVIVYKEEGEELTFSDSYICHGDLFGGDLEEAYSMLLLLDCERGEEHVNYYNWLFNESLFAEAFVTKSFEEAWLNSGVEFNVGVALNILLGACISFRFPKELPKRWRALNELVKLGVSYHEALLYSYYISIDEEGRVGSPGTPGDNTHHYLFSPDMTRVGIKNWLNKTPIPRKNSESCLPRLWETWEDPRKWGEDLRDILYKIFKNGAVQSPSLFGNRLTYHPLTDLPTLYEKYKAVMEG